MLKYLQVGLLVTVTIFFIINLQILFNSNYLQILYFILLFTIQNPFSVFGLVILSSLAYQTLFLLRTNKKEIGYVSTLLFLFSSFFPFIYSISYINNLQIFTVYLTMPIVSYTAFFPIFYLLSQFHLRKKNINPMSLIVTFLIVFIFASFMNGVFKTSNITLDSIQSIGLAEVYAMAQFFYSIYAILNNLPLTMIGKNIVVASIPTVSTFQIYVLVVILSVYFVLSLIYNRLTLEDELLKKVEGLTLKNYKFIEFIKHFSLFLFASVLTVILAIYILYNFYYQAFILIAAVIPLLLLLISFILSSR